MVKRKIRMGTIDGDFLGEFEAEVQTEEEKEEERKRQYPDTSKASYLQYACHYCGLFMMKSTEIITKAIEATKSWGD